MKKDPLLAAYEMVLEGAPENLSIKNKPVVGDLKSGDEFFDKKPEKIKAGPENAKFDKTKGSAPKASTPNLTNKPAPKVSAGENMPKKDVDEPEESEEFSDHKKINKESMTTSAFDALFKRTLAEDVDPEVEDFEGEEDVTDVDIPTETDEIVDEFDDEENDEVGDLVADLNALKDQIDAILARVEGEAEGAEDEFSDEVEGDNEFSDEDFDAEFSTEEDEDGNGIKESKKITAGKGAKLISKNNKVGNVKPKGGKANTGKVRNEPKPKALGNKGKGFQKGKPEVKSSVKKGDFIK